MRWLSRFVFGTLFASVGAIVAYLLLRDQLEERAEMAPIAPPGGAPLSPAQPKAAPQPRPVVPTQPKPESPPSRTTVSTGEAAAQLGITPEEIRELIYEEKLPAHKEGRYWRIYADDLANYQSGSSNQNSDPLPRSE